MHSLSVIKQLPPNQQKQSCLWLVWILLTSVLSNSSLKAADLYLDEVKPLLIRKCLSCHGALKQEAGLRLDTVQLMLKGGDSGPAIMSGDINASLLVDRISASDDSERMPPEGEPLTSEQIALIKTWIESGAQHPTTEKALTDPKQHWSFQPLDVTTEPASIDYFIERQLAESDLSMSMLADRRALIRRLYLVMHGLPPTPQQVDSFVNDNGQDAWERVVDHVLASPRYGERWAQHWLDIVRYADTHGFEVNTPRPNAWPYRDYVIEALNNDKPYNEFIFEQLAGDSASADAATGFLVAAPVLLPGQIGKDDASKRLARQDSLDEIIVATSATFLGLTVGCARCHDHKFDPITQHDYYSMQAFFAGVEYGDRELRDDEFQNRLEQAKALLPELATLENQLSQLQPLAESGRTLIIDDEDESRTNIVEEPNGHGTNPEGTERGYRDDPGSTNRYGNLSGGRYTWWTNKPGQDVFTWNPSVRGRFRLWVSWGTHGSGVHTRDARYVLDSDGDLNTTNDQTQIAVADQYYFSGQTKGVSEKKPLWSGLLFAGTHQLSNNSRIVLRGGETGTGITADAIILQEVIANDEPQKATHLPSLRQPVNATRNIEAFTPVTTQYVRFTSHETIDDDRHEPCLDELEVIRTADEVNIALASHGTTATSSGNYSNTGRHQLPHINDGQYGNERSWISSQKGKGWVQLQFAQPESIHRIVWGRDRNRKFNDRLPVQYQIDVSLNGSDWTTVASSADRVPMGTPHDATLDYARCKHNSALASSEIENPGGTPVPT